MSAKEDASGEGASEEGRQRGDQPGRKRPVGKDALGEGAAGESEQLRARYFSSSSSFFFFFFFLVTTLNLVRTFGRPVTPSSCVQRPAFFSAARRSTRVQTLR